jgi:hypothetical protein
MEGKTYSMVCSYFDEDSFQIILRYASAREPFVTTYFLHYINIYIGQTTLVTTPDSLNETCN